MAALLLTLGLGLQIIYLRNRLRYTERLDAAAVAKWRPILHAAIVGDTPGQLPQLKKSERIPFLRLWVYVHESLRGEAGDALNDIGRRLACDRIAQSLLTAGNRAEKLLAIMVLGRLRDASSWHSLHGMAVLPDSVVSIYAYWALMRIDAAAAIEQHMQLVLTRHDWPTTRMVLILQEAAEVCAPALNRAMEQVDEQDLPRLLQIADVLRIPVAPAILARLLQHSSPGILVAVLKLVQSPQFLPRVTEALSDADWRVRMQAAKIIGRIGGQTEVGALVKMLGDEQWWVRYRAAQALISLPFLSGATIDALRASLTDRYAVDILAHVLSEKGWA